MRTGYLWATAVLVCWGDASQARALVIAAPPLPQRLMQTDAVIVGKVVSIEPMEVMVPIYPNNPAKVKARIAVIEVSESLRGLGKEIKTVRVAFAAPPEPPMPIKGKTTPSLPIGGISRYAVRLTAGQRGLFLLNKSEDRYVFPAPMGSFYEHRNDGDLANELALVRKLSPILDAPGEALNSKNAETRYLGAATLITKYRTAQNAARLEPIDAVESKQILLALADADWTKGDQPQRNDLSPQPLQIFYQLGVGPNDGWVQPQVNTQTEHGLAVQAWLRAYCERYRIQRFVER